MEQKFVNPTQKGKNILMIRYIILFLFFCLYMFLWHPIWIQYANSLPQCEHNTWLEITYLFGVTLPFLLSIFFSLKTYKIFKYKQYPLPNALVFKPTLIVEGGKLRSKIHIHIMLTFLLILLSLFGAYKIINNVELANKCRITLFD